MPFILLAPFGGKLADRHGPLRTLPLAILGVIGVTVLYGALETPGVLMSFAMVEATFNAVALPATQAAMAARPRNTSEPRFRCRCGCWSGQRWHRRAGAAPVYAAQGQFFVFALLAAAVAVVAAGGYVPAERLDDHPHQS